MDEDTYICKPHNIYQPIALSEATKIAVEIKAKSLQILNDWIRLI